MFSEKLLCGAMTTRSTYRHECLRFNIVNGVEQATHVCAVTESWLMRDHWSPMESAFLRCCTNADVRRSAAVRRRPFLPCKICFLQRQRGVREEGGMGRVERERRGGGEGGLSVLERSGVTCGEQDCMHMTGNCFAHDTTRAIYRRSTK